MNTPSLLAAAVAGSTLIAACSTSPCNTTPNELEGSVGQRYDIAVDTVQVRLGTTKETVTIDYRHGTDSVAKVVANVAGFETGAKIPLTDGDVYRVTSPETQFPRDLERGEVIVETELTVGKTVEGCFNAVFNMEDGTQQTLEGGFEATLEEGI